MCGITLIIVLEFQIKNYLTHCKIMWIVLMKSETAEVQRPGSPRSQSLNRSEPLSGDEEPYRSPKERDDRAAPSLGPGYPE